MNKYSKIIKGLIIVFSVLTITLQLIFARYYVVKNPNNNNIIPTIKTVIKQDKWAEDFIKWLVQFQDFKIDKKDYWAKELF